MPEERLSSDSPTGTPAMNAGVEVNLSSDTPNNTSLETMGDSGSPF
ncbi:MAG: hypothetical protein LBG52_07395 [Candidatus Peribacteria bacterium]|nr:hypothetical protein [Candidatus Peribacteria bacterium]